MTEAPEAVREAVLREATRGLTVAAGTQKTLPPWLFYDERGSDLFEQITRLPEYYLTRAERSIFTKFSREILAFAHGPITVAELGAGSASKTGILLAAAAESQPDLLYQPVDVSESALAAAERSLTESIAGLRVKPQIANYVTETYAIERPAGCNVLALYIGSSIGNFSPPEATAILRRLRKQLKGISDGILLGVDLAPCAAKSVDQLIAAYDDAAGVTAAFNKNILARLNREIEADFDLDSFTHRARWNAAESRVEMHLESQIAQNVHFGDALGGAKSRPIHFEAGETIHTENSYKFTERGLRPLLTGAGFGSPHLLHDPDHRFAVALAHVG
ncbi:MAG: L-histidine N(alpha)-methyltransferase [Janthinobacterium lividum]